MKIFSPSIITNYLKNIIMYEEVKKELNRIVSDYNLGLINNHEFISMYENTLAYINLCYDEITRQQFKSIEQGYNDSLQGIADKILKNTHKLFS